LSIKLTLVIDGGYCGLESTTVIDLEQDVPVVVREGCGDLDLFVA
jgi:tRNA A37 threonylcarbamoyladenosine synthetase subunit TsaC/SUA5/YrdC